MLSAASPRSGLRRALVLWLYAAGAGHLLVGLLLTWAGHSGLFNDYLASIEQAFWGAAAPAPGRAQQIWWLGLFGATLQSYALYLLALVHLGARLHSPAAWAWLMAGLLLWAPQDMWLSWQVGMHAHLWVDSLALLVLLPPLLWLYRHDRRTRVLPS
ncbi:hypothetical protein [Pseudomonas chlororaphis]|uniref:Cell division protein n=1 Tax=Pseudomonas chlororaphis TaxID=587753 RepID=A0A0D5XXI0_9PSED|nr:hypothetical protein [Pseudomonas chlororaphis]AKA23530.1 hypothetical protein PCL1606_20770 [Pseudomonas chlororaphis]